MRFILSLFILNLFLSGCSMQGQEDISIGEGVEIVDNRSDNKDIVEIAVEDKVDNEDIVNNYGNVEYLVNWPSEHKLSIEYFNNTEYSLFFERIGDVQKLVDGEWLDIDIPPITVHERAIIMEPNDSYTEIININLLGNLEAGRYRLIKTLIEYRRDNLTDSFADSLKDEMLVFPEFDIVK